MRDRAARARRPRDLVELAVLTMRFALLWGALGVAIGLSCFALDRWLSPPAQACPVYVTVPEDIS